MCKQWAVLAISAVPLPQNSRIIGEGWEGGEWLKPAKKLCVFRFKGYKIKTQKRFNTEPHGVPEALDGFVGKVVEFSTIWNCRECLELTRTICFLHLKGS